MVDGVSMRRPYLIAQIAICISKGESRRIWAMPGGWWGWCGHRTAEDGRFCHKNHVESPADRWSTVPALMGFKERSS